MTESGAVAHTVVSDSQEVAAGGHGFSRVFTGFHGYGAMDIETDERSDAHLQHAAITKQVIVAFYEVYNELGEGFLESVYQAALGRVLCDAGLGVVREQAIEVFFRGAVIGRFFADLVVEERVVVELKAMKALRAEHEAQLIHYLRATGIEVGLLLNFGPRPEFKRMVYSNILKRSLRL